MPYIYYPKHDPRRLEALVPHGSKIEVIGRTANVVTFKFQDETHYGSPDFIYDQKMTPKQLDGEEDE